MSSLTILSLHGNSLNGGIPDNVCQYLPNIQVQNLGNNQFGGPLPSKLWPCKELLELVLENNNFSGSIPKNMGNLAQLMEIYIACNNLTEEDGIFVAVLQRRTHNDHARTTEKQSDTLHYS
ncbi:hypothetical protein CerSpe_246030 [Prunus speciosa]